jgi:hypothetical protein
MPSGVVRSETGAVIRRQRHSGERASHIVGAVEREYHLSFAKTGAAPDTVSPMVETADFQESDHVTVVDRLHTSRRRRVFRQRETGP